MRFLQQRGWLTVTYSPEGSHSPSAWTGPARSRSPWGLSGETWTTLAAGRSEVSFHRAELRTKASLVVRSGLWRCFPSPVERKGQPMTDAKQTCSSSPVQWLWNRVTHIWMETIANISQHKISGRSVELGLSVGNFTNCKWFWLPTSLCHLFLRSSKQLVYHQTIQRVAQCNARCGLKCNKTSVPGKTVCLSCHSLNYLLHNRHGNDNDGVIRSGGVVDEQWICSLPARQTSFSQTAAQFRSVGRAANIGLGCGNWIILARKD